MSAQQMTQVAALLVLLAAFLGLLIWLLRPGAREAAQRAAAIPFHKDDEIPPASEPGTGSRIGKDAG